MIFVFAFETEEERVDFADFYDKYKEKCFHAALAVTGNHAFAEDAVQEAFLKMIRRKEKYFRGSCKKTDTQIVIMVKSTGIDILRREKSLDHIRLEDIEHIIENEEPDMLRVVEGKEAVQRLRHHISLLGEVNQTILEAKYILGKTDTEIGKMIGMGRGAVSARIHRMTQKLRETMREEGYANA